MAQSPEAAPGSALLRFIRVESLRVFQSFLRSSGTEKLMLLRKVDFSHFFCK